MKPIPSFLAFSALVLSTSIAHSQTASKPLPIPYKPDPAFTIDGDLGDWNEVPEKIILDDAKHATYGAGKWEGADDLSAAVQMAWRGEAFYFAADVTDDDFHQTQRSANLWKGDHLELYLDIDPQSAAAKSTFGARQFHLGFSPGNFTHSGDALNDLPAEAYAFSPAATTLHNVQIASRRTARGYIIEASIPWRNFDFAPTKGVPLGMEVAISDTDTQEAGQGTMLTIATTAWQRNNRQRLLSAVLANADGSAPSLTTQTPLFQESQLAPGQSATFTFDAPAVPAGYQALLTLNGRMDTKAVGGFTQALQITLNGVTIDPDRLANKSASEERVNGAFLSSFRGNVFTVPYAPNFTDTDSDNRYAFKNAKTALLQFRVTDLLKPTGNVLIIRNAVKAGITRTLVTGDAQLLYNVPPVAKVLLGPPTGPLPTIAPRPIEPIDYQMTQNGDSQLAVQIGKSTFAVSSQYSTPDGKWVNGSNKYFSVKRDIQKHGEWMVVRDTFTNLTNENLPLMHREEVAMQPDKVWLGGLSPNGAVGTSTRRSNPTVFGVQGKTGIGLLPLDDVFGVHIKNYSTGKAIGLADENLVIKPHSTYTAEWAIVPVASADYFDFINATRRLLEVNFTVDGSFAFLRANPTVSKWSDQKIVDFARFKDAKYLSYKFQYPLYQGRVLHGTANQKVDFTLRKEAIARRRKLLPDVKQLSYFHSFLDSTDEAAQQFSDARMLLHNGEHADYGRDYLKLYIPTLQNSFGKAIEKNIDMILDEWKLDGVYWDEFMRSRYDYTYDPQQWDGVSADINPKTMQITTLKSSVTLLSLPWRLKQVQRILKNHTLVTNGGTPHTRTMRALHHPAFVETGSISNCTGVHLYSPIALGDHLTERSEEDAYHTMLKALDYGCLYYWYDEFNVIPEYHTLTQYMFPITPLELHEGYIIGKERIITNRSGVFSWNDNARHEVHVFDNTGREVLLDKLPAGTVVKSDVKDGKTYTEIRIGENWSAAIVRK